MRGKGFKGAVGTSASYAELLAGTGMTPRRVRATHLMDALGAGRLPGRHADLPAQAGLPGAIARWPGWARSLYKFAFDLRVLQSPPIGEWAEPFGARQVGSSAMPFKRNPINAEKIDCLARHLAALPRVAWDNAAHTLLERTLDDSANRRSLLPEAFLIADELLRRGLRLIEGLRVDEARDRRDCWPPTAPLPPPNAC